MSNDYTYGTADDVADRLMYSDVDLCDAVGALANAMRRIAALEKLVSELRIEVLLRAADGIKT
jgi:hypothetical protein